MFCSILYRGKNIYKYAPLNRDFFHCVTITVKERDGELIKHVYTQMGYSL